MPDIFEGLLLIVYRTRRWLIDWEESKVGGWRTNFIRNGADNRVYCIAADLRNVWLPIQGVYSWSTMAQSLVSLWLAVVGIYASTKPSHYVVLRLNFCLGYVFVFYLPERCASTVGWMPADYPCSRTMFHGDHGGEDIMAKSWSLQRTTLCHLIMSILTQHTIPL